MPDKTNRINIYLIKDDPDIAKIVRDDVDLVELSDGSAFYGKDSFIRPPDWVTDFFGAELAGKFDFKTTSSRGLLIKEATWNGETRRFAITFGNGRFFLKDGVLEDRFGMKVVLNSVASDSLRSVDRTVLGSAPRQSREQVSRESEASSFGIDIEQDLLNGVTGRSNDSRFGKMISGRDALCISVKVNFANLAPLLSACLEKYRSNDYETDFKWIDQIRDIRNPSRISKLNNWLIKAMIEGKTDTIWLAPPEILDWVKTKGFKYGAPKRGSLHSDLDTTEFLASIEGKAITLELLKGRLIYAISSDNDEPFEHWSTYRCIYAEAPMGENVCILNNGKWYEIAGNFTLEVQQDFQNMMESDTVLPNYKHQNEGAYNAGVSAEMVGAVCFDADTIPHGGGYSKIEFCDIFTPSNQLIHVKRYSGSADLSHLFNQGVVSGELFASDAVFREKVNDKLPDARKFVDTNARPKVEDFEIIFGIIMPPGRVFDIPFFSKVALRNARRRLQGYGYQVTRRGISSDPQP